MSASAAVHPILQQNKRDEVTNGRVRKRKKGIIYAREISSVSLCRECRCSAGALLINVVEK